MGFSAMIIVRITVVSQKSAHGQSTFLQQTHCDITLDEQNQA